MVGLFSKAKMNFRMEKLRQSQGERRSERGKLPAHPSHTAVEERRSKNHHDFNCKVRSYRQQVAKGIYPGPEELMPCGKPIYCHTCDQNLQLPLVGEGRCPCHDCAVVGLERAKKSKFWCDQTGL